MRGRPGCFLVYAGLLGRTALAYLRIFRVCVHERLWHIPARAPRPDQESREPAAMAPSPGSPLSRRAGG